MLKKKSLLNFKNIFFFLIIRIIIRINILLDLNSDIDISNKKRKVNRSRDL